MVTVALVCGEGSFLVGMMELESSVASGFEWVLCSKIYKHNTILKKLEVKADCVIVNIERNIIIYKNEAT